MLIFVLLAGCAIAHERGDATTDACMGLSRPSHPLGVPAQHRASSIACPIERGAILPTSPCDVASDPACAMNPCNTDAECTAGVNGRCSHLHHGPVDMYHFCTYDECQGDDGCMGGLCECRDDAMSAVANACLHTGNCRVDSDCGPGGFCSPNLVNAGFCACPTADMCVDAGNGTGCFESIDGGPWIAIGCICGNTCAAPGYYCHTPCDECASNSDCDSGSCVYDERESRWACRTVICTSGP